MLRMAVPSSLQSQSLTLPIKRSIWNNEMDFGAYRVRDVQMGWTETHRVGGWIAKHVASSQRFRFSLQKGNDVVWENKCLVTRDKDVIKFRGPIRLKLTTQQKDSLHCAFSPNQDSAFFWELDLYQDYPQPAQGRLHNNDTRFGVKASHRVQDSEQPIFWLAGYTFDSQGRVLGAVDALTEGVVWLDRGLPPQQQDALASTSVALLLQQKLFSH
ncbi:hypothetical protein L6R29_20145 [Myxococcota bacterium]|nr:hypothetical protein [Myxococcota bacterium]